MKQSIRNPVNKRRPNPLIGKELTNLFLGFLGAYFDERRSVYVQWFSQYLRFINNLSECRGKRQALAYNKLARLSITRYLSGEPLPKNTPGIALSHDGLPKNLFFLHPVIRARELDDLKIVFTMLNLSRGVVLEPVNDFKSISDPGEGSLPKHWDTFRSAVKRQIGYRRTRYIFGNLHTSTKSGPNGQAMLTAFEDYLALPNDLKDQIVKLGGPKMADIFAKLEETFQGIPLHQLWYKLTGFPNHEGKEIRKLTTFGDKEGKTRVIGILDYWSQTVLRPIHKALEKILRRIPEDCTFDQDAGYTKLPAKCVYYSFDLTNATDRLPVKHQKLIVADVFGKRVADAGEFIISHYDMYHKGTQTRVKYETGQPMGAYSSGPVMALQHHSIVHYAGLLVGVNPKGKYVLLGDDIVIADEQLANSYQTVMESELRVSISKMKTHKSKEMCEFAKRGYFRGTEITAFPLHSLRKNLSRYYLLQNSIEDSRKKGYRLSEQSEQGSLVKLIQLTGKKSQALRIYKLYKLFDALVRKDDGEEQIGKIREVILANGSIPESNQDKLKPENWNDHLNWCLEEYFLDLTSEGNQEMTEMMDLIKLGGKSAKQIDQKVGDNLSLCHPIVSSFKTCGTERSSLLDRYYKEFANDKSKLRGSLLILGSLPTTSIKITNTRSSHKILASTSRLVKTILNSVCVVQKPESEMTEEDWIAQMRTIKSSESEEALS